jgi:hypothetical protein
MVPACVLAWSGQRRIGRIDKLGLAVYTHNFSGIGVSCGGMCNVCLTYLSVPVISFSVPKGDDYIDTSARVRHPRSRHPHQSREGARIPF